VIIDFHNHFYPPEYLEAVARGQSRVRMTRDAEGNPVLHYPGDYNVAVPGHRDIAFRQAVLEEAGIDRQVLTFTTPGTHFDEPAVAVELARIVNDAYAAIARERSPRFTALATLPLNDPAASVRELERAVATLRLPGAMLFSNVNGTPLADRCYLPLYEAADALGCVLQIHPAHPLGVEAMTDYWLMPLVGFPFDTTLAAAHLVFAGVMERYPRIRWVLAHLGGALPYLAERLDRGYEAFPDCRRDIRSRPSEYLRRCWYDTVNFDPRALRLALDFAGPSQLLAGSDYPHQIGSLEKMRDSLAALELDPGQEAMVLGRNAEQLLGQGSERA
jgi:aminocarboxymuconate-semialdehyde decarboxylase